MKAKRVYESVDFQRGKDPKDAIGIGLSPEQKFKNISRGDIYITVEDMPIINIPLGTYILVLSVSDVGYMFKDITYVRGRSYEDLIKTWEFKTPDIWGWGVEFFTESLEKVGKLEI